MGGEINWTRVLGEIISLEKARIFQQSAYEENWFVPLVVVDFFSLWRIFPFTTLTFVNLIQTICLEMQLGMVALCCAGEMIITFCLGESAPRMGFPPWTIFNFTFFPEFNQLRFYRLSLIYFFLFFLFQDEVSMHSRQSNGEVTSASRYASGGEWVSYRVLRNSIWKLYW